jgi:peptide chain release factor subunit 1
MATTRKASTRKATASKVKTPKAPKAVKGAARKNAAAPDLLRMQPGAHPVVSCYLKLEARDRTRAKYLTKVRNRIKALDYALPSLRWDKAAQDAIRADFGRILDFLAEPANLPATQGVAIFASQGQKLFEVRPLPRVHRSRLAVDRTPLVRELAASEEEFGKLFTVVLDRHVALIWEVTAYEAKMIRRVETEVMRGGRYHGTAARNDLTAEHTYHNRIQNEKKRHLEAVARALFEEDRKAPGHQLVLAGVGADPGALEPFLHNYLADRLIGIAKLAPKDASPAAVHELTMDVREAHARASETRHVEELAESLPTGWAVNGIKATLRALANGQVRTLLVHAEATQAGFRSLATGRLAIGAVDLRTDGEVVPVLDVVDDAIEEALRQQVALDVVHDVAASQAIDGLAGLLRFK